MSEMHKCTITTHEEGTTIISCKKGLWCVRGVYGAPLVSEAYHYFRQYKADGEYHEILGGKSPAEILKGE